MVIPDEIIRSKRKTLAISVDSFGRLIVRAPLRCSEERIFAFLREKESWILRKKAETAGAGMRLPPENLDGYSFLLLGKECQIRLTDEKNIGFDEEKYLLYLPAEKAEARLVRWLKENARRILTKTAETWALKMGVTFRSVTISSAKSRWGSCSFDNRLRFSFRLLYAPKDCIEYVVVHELAHTKHKNHSRGFWEEVERYVPDWKMRRKWLKTHGALMQIF